MPDASRARRRVGRRETAADTSDGPILAPRAAVVAAPVVRVVQSPRGLILNGVTIWQAGSARRAAEAARDEVATLYSAVLLRRETGRELVEILEMLEEADRGLTVGRLEAPPGLYVKLQAVRATSERLGRNDVAANMAASARLVRSRLTRPKVHEAIREVVEAQSRIEHALIGGRKGDV